MRSGFRRFVVLALVTVGASIAAAQSSSSAYAYASATFLISTPGVYFEVQGYTGGYYGGGFGTYSVHPGAYSWGASYFSNGFTAYAVVEADTEAWPVPGGSNVAYGLYAIGQAFIYNATGNSVYVSVTFDTLSSGSSSLDNWNASASSNSEAEVTDGRFGPAIQYAGEETSFAGNNAAWDTQGYDPYNGAFGGSFSGYVPIPGSVSASIYDQQTYSYFVEVDSQQVTEVDVLAFEGSRSFATTPAPAALVPFGMGMLGITRKRLKRR